MNPRRLTLSVSLPAVLLLAGGVYIGDRHAQDPVVKLQGAIGVVDIDACLLGYPPAIARQQGLERTRLGWQNNIKAITTKGKALTDDLLLLAQGSDEWWTKKTEVAALQFQLDQDAERYKIQFQIKWDEMRAALYDEISRGIAAYAAKTGHQLILRSRATPANATIREIVQVNARRDVLYSAPELDLTQKVTKFLKGWKPKPKPK